MSIPVTESTAQRPILRLTHHLTYLYATWLVSHPFTNAIFSSIFLISSLVFILCSSDLPSFDDPAKEFVTIGTPMAAKLYQLKALQQNTVSVPPTTYDYSRRARSIGGREKIKFCFELPDQGSDELWSRFASMGKVVVSLHSEDKVDGENNSFLTSPKAVGSLCQLQTRLEALPGYRQLCSKPSLTDLNSICCPIWSLANFIASIVGRTSCHQITDEDVRLVKGLYETCRESFLSGALKRACWDEIAPSRWLCPDVPPQCFTHPHLLLLLATSAPPPSHHGNFHKWNASLLVLPLWKGVGLQLLHLASLDRPQTLAHLVRNLSPPLIVDAMELGSYGELAGRYVARDSVWLGLGAACLAILLLLLTRGNVVVVGATFLALGWSIVLAYGLYAKFILRLPTFPLLNIMAVVLLLGLGADDILLFYQVWVSVPLWNNNHGNSGGDVNNNPIDEGTEDSMAVRIRSRTQRMTITLRHAVPSICLTSLSTLGGLLVSLNSATVAVVRFAVYASLTVVCHTVYVLVVMPVLLQLFVPPHRCHGRFRLFHLPRFPLSNFIVRVRFLFPILLLLVIFTSAYLLFHAGWLSFPSGPLQPAFYSPSNPVEVYRLHGGEFSWAEHILRRQRGLVSLHAVWGVKPHDPRNHWTWTPSHDEDTVFQPIWKVDFNLTAPESLQWLSYFCSEIKKMPYAIDPPYISPRTGFLEEAALLLPSENHGCVFGSSGFSFKDFAESTPLCSYDTGACLAAFAKTSPRPTGVRFSLKRMRIVGLVISVNANLSLTNTTFWEIQEFAQKVEAWFSSVLATAPSGLAGGFIVSPELTAFEAYQDVMKFLPLSLSLSVVLTALLVLLSTLNFQIALVALLSVMASLLFSCLLLVTLGAWSLGIVEALILSISAGLAVDPCIHLSFAIIHSDSGDESEWLKRCQTALKRVGSAVTGAAVSTAIAGCAVLPSELRFCQQMGLFLLVLMTTSLLICGVGFVGTIACLPEVYFNIKCLFCKSR